MRFDEAVRPAGEALDGLVAAARGLHERIVEGGPPVDGTLWAVDSRGDWPAALGTGVGLDLNGRFGRESGLRPLDARIDAHLVPALMHATASGLTAGIGVCGDTDCDTAFFDLSRSHTTTCCCARCTTRARVRRHRQTTEPPETG